MTSDSPIESHRDARRANSLGRDDARQLSARDINLETLYRQIDSFKADRKPARLDRPCVVGDGIRRIDAAESAVFEAAFATARDDGRLGKFVPASGAATRMFQDLRRGTTAGSTPPELRRVFERLADFAFFGDLTNALASRGIEIGDLMNRNDHKRIVAVMLDRDGLDYDNRPKGLIPFHRYGEHYRTALEEHLVEALDNLSDQAGTARVHFTVDPAHLDRIGSFIANAARRHGGDEANLDIGISAQASNSETIAVGLDNEPIRDGSGALIFRPGGHGALLTNLNQLGGDIVLIKNIDNIVPDQQRAVVDAHRPALAGLLITLQAKIHGFLQALANAEPDGAMLEQMLDFSERELADPGVTTIRSQPRATVASYLQERFDRPIRVCGMVATSGEPGGGPFWCQGTSFPLQIVESVEVDLDEPRQQEQWRASRFFNPVDIVCGVRGHRNEPYDLSKFVNHDNPTIGRKIFEGREIKVLEHPGLWNGSMALWNTVFVEVPSISFNPVKSLADLLRPIHLAQPDSG